MENMQKSKKLESVIDALKYRGSLKKLEVIEEYIADTFPDAKCEIHKKEDLLNYSELPLEDEDFDNIFYLINQSFPIGEPYYLHKLEFINKSTLNDVKQRFEKLIDDEYSFRTEEFTLYDFTENFYDGSELEISAKYDRYSTRHIPGGTERVNDKPVSYGEITYIFKPISHLLLIKIGDKKINTIAFNLLVAEFYDLISVDFFKLSESNINYAGPNDAKKITIFLLELITKHLADETHIIAGHTKVGFKNPSASRLKTLIVGGNNLLSDDAIADQVSDQASLKSVEMQVLWIYDKRNNINIRVTFSINVEGPIKITIKEISQQGLSVDIIKYVYERIFDLLEHDIIISGPSVLTHYFPQVISRRKIRENIILDSVCNKLLKDLTLNKYKNNIIEIINELKE